MPAPLKLIVVLTKEVADTAQGQAIFDLVQQRLEDRPDVEITGRITSTLEITPNGP